MRSDPEVLLLFGLNDLGRSANATRLPVLDVGLADAQRFLRHTFGAGAGILLLLPALCALALVPEGCDELMYGY